MIFRSLTRRREIGANSYLLQNKNHRMVLDAGMHPGERGFDALPNFSLVPHDSLDAVLITHAHHDHIGSLPVLQQRQPSAPVYMTEATGELSSAMLHNSVNVMTRQREEQGVMEYPLFTHTELDQIRAKWNYHPTRKPFAMGRTNVECTLFDAGHIMGSAGALLRENGKTLFYTGDVNFEAQTIVREADFPREKIDALIVETTRGDHARPEGFSRRDEKERLAALIRETYERGGSVLIPVFALGKSQELLVTLHELRQLNLIPDMPVIIGGLTTKITLLYDQYASRVRRSYEGFRIMEDMGSLVAPRKGRREINLAARTIYALSSGMMTEGTISNEFARRFVTQPNNTVAFVGYTDPKTPGWRMRNAKAGDVICLDEKKPPVEVRCQIESFDFSAHAARETIVDYVRAVQPAKVLLVHGDAPAMDWFAGKFSEALPNSEIILPEPGEEITLW